MKMDLLAYSEMPVPAEKISSGPKELDTTFSFNKILQQIGSILD
jgi:hypothetical protein